MLPKKNIRKQLGGKAITAVVGQGDNKRDFIVHEELICESSEFFRKALAGNWKETQDRIVKLPEDDPDMFALYLQAVYNGHVQLDPVDQHEAMISWASVYILADKLMDVVVKNIVVRQCYEIRGKLWLIHMRAALAVQIIYEGTSGPCGMRQLFVDSAIYHYDYTTALKNAFSAAMKHVPREFLEDFTLATIAKKDRVFKRVPLCACPDTRNFYDYEWKYLESRTEHAQNIRQDYEEAMTNKRERGGDCEHEECCRCLSSYEWGSPEKLEREYFSRKRKASKHDPSRLV